MKLYSKMIKDISELKKDLDKIRNRVQEIHDNFQILKETSERKSDEKSEDDELYAVYGGD